MTPDELTGETTKAQAVNVRNRSETVGAPVDIPDPVRLLRQKTARTRLAPPPAPLSLYHGDNKVGEGRIKIQPGTFSIAGEGLCVGRDSGEPVTGDYPGARESSRCRWRPRAPGGLARVAFPFSPLSPDRGDPPGWWPVCKRRRLSRLPLASGSRSWRGRGAGPPAGV